MANARSGNTHYVDSTGTLTDSKHVKLVCVVLTATSAGAVLVLQDDSSSANKLNLQIADDNTTQVFDFSNTPIVFANGIEVSTLTNAIATLVYNG